MPDPIQINPIDLDPDIALGINLPIDASNGSSMSSTYFTKDQVKANFRNVLSTMIGERVMQPEFGTYLYNFLFEQSTEDLKSKQITAEVERCARVWVPQILEKDVSYPKNIDEKKITVKVKYTIPNYNLEDELEIEVS